MAQILFTRRSNFGSSVIRAGAWSGYSHTQIVDGNLLWGAAFPHGVGQEDMSYRLALASRAAIMTIPTPDDAAVVAFAESQNGVPYDFLGAFGLGLHRDWQDPTRWWCSEYVAACVQASGKKLFRDGATNRVTPEHLFMMPYEVKILK